MNKVKTSIIVSLVAVALIAVPAISAAQEAPDTGRSTTSSAPGTGDTVTSAAPSAPGTGNTESSAGSSAPGTGDSVTSAGPSEETPSDTSRGGSGSSKRRSAGTKVTTPVISCPLITSYMKVGAVNDSAQVTSLQTFLKNVEQIDVDVTGVFDAKTETAVKAFQTKYQSSILGPWDATRATGIVYITTMKKLNELACATPVTITAAEQAVIDAYKTKVASPESQNSDTNPSDESEVGSTDEANTAAVGEASVMSRFWGFIKGLFR